jgi:hypothetical protein
MTVTRLPWRAIVCAYWASQLMLSAQTTLDLRTQTKNVDFTQAVTTKPNKSGGALPATCSVGETFFLTRSPAGQNLYGCTTADVWSALGASLLPASSEPGQVLAWNGSSWQPKSGLGVNLALSFSSIADGTCAEQSAATPFPWLMGSPVTLAMPTQYCDATSGTCYAPAGLMPSVRISASAVATVRICNFSGAPQSLPMASYGVVQYGNNPTTTRLSFPAIADGGCATLTVTVPGATAASAVAVGLPPALEQGLVVAAAPSGPGLVAISACNWSGATMTPAPASYQLNVI